MREFLLNLFGTIEGNVEITLFSIWHILYMLIIIGTTIAASLI